MLRVLRCFFSGFLILLGTWVFFFFSFRRLGCGFYVKVGFFYGYKMICFFVYVWGEERFCFLFFKKGSSKVLNKFLVKFFLSFMVRIEVYIYFLVYGG